MALGLSFNILSSALRDTVLLILVLKARLGNIKMSLVEKREWELGLNLMLT
jgi:hypothetical protein